MAFPLLQLRSSCRVLATFRSTGFPFHSFWLRFLTLNGFLVLAAFRSATLGLLRLNRRIVLSSLWPSWTLVLFRRHFGSRLFARLVLAAFRPSHGPLFGIPFRLFFLVLLPGPSALWLFLSSAFRHAPVLA